MWFFHVQMNKLNSFCLNQIRSEKDPFDREKELRVIKTPCRAHLYKHRT